MWLLYLNSSRILFAVLTELEEFPSTSNLLFDILFWYQSENHRPRASKTLVYDCRGSAMNFAGREMQKTCGFDPSPKSLCNRRILNMVLFPTNALARYYARKIENMADHISSSKLSDLRIFLNAGVNTYIVQDWTHENCSLTRWQKAMLRSGSFMGIVQRGM